MIQTVEAVVDEGGGVRLLQPVEVSGSQRAIVTVLDEKYVPDSHETASLSEPALAKDWDRPEEDAAWSYLSNGSVILVPFPFSDLRQSKMRPAVVLAPAERGDWILCQITSNPYGDARAIELTNADFVTGGLRIVSYARPTKLFTAHESLLVKEAGKLHAATHRKICDAVIAIIR